MKYLYLAIFFVCTGFLLPLGILFLALFFWNDGIKDAIKKEEKETSYINGFDSNMVEELR